MAVLGTHLKWKIMGRGVVVAVTNGRLDGSTERSTEFTPRARRNLWHLGADLVSLESRRRKRVLVKIIGE
jgi:hypothetical protein